MAATKTFDDWKSQELLKVTIPQFQLSDCPDSDRLAGEYVVKLTRSSDQMLLWRVRFPAVCGFRQLQVVAYRDDLGDALLQVFLYGSGRYAFWSRHVTDADPSPYTLDFEAADSVPQEWPRQVTLEALPAKAAMAAGPAASALLTGIDNCFCEDVESVPLDFRYHSLKVATGGMSVGPCCSALLDRITLTYEETCYWIGDNYYTSGGCNVGQSINMAMGVESACEWWADFWMGAGDGVSNGWFAIFTHTFKLEEFSPTGPLETPLRISANP